jgi:hypothetical protein
MLEEIMKNSKELHEPTPPSDRLIKEDEYPELLEQIKMQDRQLEALTTKLLSFGVEYIEDDDGHWYFSKV